MRGRPASGKGVAQNLNFVLLALLPVILTACATVLGRPKPGVTVRQEVSACFRQGEEGHILATVRPSKCYSIRCTKIQQASGIAFLDRDAYRLEFEATFLFSEIEPFLTRCTPDCAGGGKLVFDLGSLDVGIYAVYLWDEYIGELSVTSGLPWRDQCIPERPKDG